MRIRDAKKRASRGRVVEAARVLFEEVGFQETTVRMIAERAGLSPGGVFTTFDDKVAILCQILAEQRESLICEIEQLVPTLTGPVRDRIEAVVSLCHAREVPRLKMVVAYIGASYGWNQKLEEQCGQLHRRLRQVLGEMLQDGVDRGEIRPEAGLELLVELITSAYERNFRTAHYAGLRAEDLDKRVRRQLNLLFDGARTR
ncbi:MAG TPA: TetR/AcrR family transcriptional regulator [Caulobacteraceae bacterium]|nr:TetR/AcrR family transcriptional regulator [Caulobacteraceae bacterium]